MRPLFTAPTSFFSTALIASAVLSSSALLTACGGDSSSSTEIVGPREIAATIPFAAVVGDADVVCGEDYLNVGSDASTVSFVDFRFYVHDFKLVTDTGAEIELSLDDVSTTASGESDASETSPSQNSRVAQLDFRDTLGCEAEADVNPNFNDGVQVIATVEEGVTVAAIRFTLGVPFDLNHKDQAAADEPLRNPGRASGAGWNWQGGYKFTGIDVAPVGGWTDPQDGERTGNRWNMHLGSTGCPVSLSDLESGTEPETCENPNRPEITIELGAIDVEQAEIVIDYAALVSGVSVAQDEGGAPGCMSGTTDPECEAVFANLGLGLDLGTGENAESEQSVFSVREKASAE